MDQLFWNWTGNTFESQNNRWFPHYRRWFHGFKSIIEPPRPFRTLFSPYTAPRFTWIRKPFKNTLASQHTRSVTNSAVKWHLIIDFQAVLRSPFASPFVFLDGIAPASLILRLPHLSFRVRKTFSGRGSALQGLRKLWNFEKSMKKVLINRSYWWIGTICGKNCWMKFFVSLFYCFLGKALSTALSSARSSDQRSITWSLTAGADRWRDLFSLDSSMIGKI